MRNRRAEKVSNENICLQWDSNQHKTHQKCWTTINRFLLPLECISTNNNELNLTYNVLFKKCTKIHINTNSLRVDSSVPLYSPNCLLILRNVFRVLWNSLLKTWDLSDVDPRESKGSDNWFIVVHHFWCIKKFKICQIICRVLRKWMKSTVLDQDVDVVFLANKGIVVGCFVGRNYYKAPMETGKLSDNIRFTSSNSTCNYPFWVHLPFYCYWILYICVLVTVRFVEELQNHLRLYHCSFCIGDYWSFSLRLVILHWSMLDLILCIVCYVMETVRLYNNFCL